MEVFGIIGMSFASLGIIAFVIAINLTKKVAELEERIKVLENN